jgi:hypothetical protein
LAFFSAEYLKLGTNFRSKLAGRYGIEPFEISLKAIHYYRAWDKSLQTGQKAARKAVYAK